MEEASRPRILIIVPTLGRRNSYLVQTLDSIKDQAAEPADVVVVAPQDAIEARQLARERGARVADDPGGMAASLNAGMATAAARHTYVNWIGDDDLLTPGSLAISAGALDASPGAVVAFGACDYVDGDGRVLWTSRAGRFAPWLMTWGPNLVPQPGALFRLAAVREAGGLDPSLVYAMDLDLWLRLRRLGRFASTGHTLAAFRWHATSVTVANRNASLDESEAIKRRYYTPAQRRLAFLWERPVRAATRIAARRLNARAALSAS